MTTLEIVVHATPSYAACLALFLQALAAQPPRTCRVTLTVYRMGDEDTHRALTLFAPRNGSTLSVRTIVQPPRQLGRRAIGRDHAARATEADWVWFADADYLVGPHFLDGACARLRELPLSATLAIPRWVWRPTRAYSRDLLATAFSAPALPTGRAMVPERCCEVSGGAMFVRGDVCRERGYVPGVEPAGEDGWQPPAEDAIFRARVCRGRPSVFFASRVARLYNPAG